MLGKWQDKGRAETFEKKMDENKGIFLAVDEQRQTRIKALFVVIHIHTNNSAGLT